MVEVKVGAATVRRVEESYEPNFDAKMFFPDWKPEVVQQHRDWLMPAHYEESSNSLKLSVHSWLLTSGGKRILIDTCVGNHKSRPHRPKWHLMETPYLARLKAAGVEPEQVDMVMCTHLHVDHVGWNTRLENGKWVPTFKNAKYLFAKREYAHWENEHKTKGLETNGGSFDDSVLPVVEAGKAVMIDSDHQPDPMLTIRDYPGHTPGSIAINLKDDGKLACFSGDIMHHPIQVYHPDWSSQFCSDQEMSARSRRKLLEDCVESNALLCPAHFPGENAGYIKSAGDSFRIEWDQQ